MGASKIILRLLPLCVAIRLSAVLGGDIPIAHAQETADDGFITSLSASARLPLRLGSATMSEVPKMRASAKSKRLNAALEQGRHAADLTDSVTVPIMTNEQQHHRRAKKGKALKAKRSKAPKSKLKAKRSKAPKSKKSENFDVRTWFEFMGEYEELYNARLEIPRTSPQRLLELALYKQHERLNKLEQDAYDAYDLARRRLEVNNAASDPGCDQNEECSRIIGAINLVQGVVKVFINIVGCVFKGEENCKVDWFEQGLILVRAGVTILSFFVGGWAIFAVVVVELLAVVVDIWRALKDSKEQVVTLTNSEMLAEIKERTESINKSITDKTLEAKLVLEVSDLETWYAHMLTFNTMFSSDSMEDITFDINESVEALFTDVSKYNFGDLLWNTQIGIERVFSWFTKREKEYARHKFFLSKTMFKTDCKDGPCGKGAVNSLVNGDNTQAQKCLTDNQGVIETIPLYFQGISAVKEIVSTHNNLILQSKLAVENIRNIATFAGDDRLRNFDEMVTCRSKNILLIIEKLEDRKQKHADHCMTLDEILDANAKKTKNGPFDFGLPRDFDMMVMRQNSVPLRLAQNTLNWDYVAGALVQTCTKNGKCNFPYLLGRCGEEKLTGNAAVTISDGSNNVPNLRRETCDVENNRISWDEVRRNNAPDGSGYWQDCLVTFKAGSGKNPPATEQGCNCGKVVDQCQRIGFCWTCSDKNDWLKKHAYVYALPEYCMRSQITGGVKSSTREETCHDEMSDNSKWAIQPDRCRVDLVDRRSRELSVLGEMPPFLHASQAGTQLR